MNKPAIIFSGAHKDFSMRAVLMPEGYERNSKDANQRGEEEIPGLYCAALSFDSLSGNNLN